MYPAIHILRSVVNDLMRVICCQSFIGHERIAVESRASRNMLAYFLLQYRLATAWHNGSANLSATLKDAHNGSLVLRSGCGDASFALTQVHVPSLAADEGLIDFHFAIQFRSEEFVLHR